MLKNEIPFEDLKDGDVVWACAHSRAVEGYANLLQLPIKGIVSTGKYRWSTKFIPFKKDGITPRRSGAISINARHCFRTYEDCVNGFNQRIDSQIERLERAISNLENEKILNVEGEIND